MSSNVVEWIREFLIGYQEKWWELSTDPPELSLYSIREQRTLERELNQFTRQFPEGLLRLLEQAGSDSVYLGEAGNRLREFTCRVLPGASHLWKSSTAGIPFFDAATSAAQVFIQAARDFDPDIAPADIFQALRNLWTANGLQLWAGYPVASTQPLLAYSLLYPYTDNYLDDSRIPLGIKQEFNRRFQDFLDGGEFVPKNTHEASLSRLIGMIRDAYPVPEYPQVAQGLNGIHAAQVRSIKQLFPLPGPYHTDILGISFEKGGCSVLADGFLIHGSLNRDEAQLLFGLGILLQLIDDLRDFEIDRRHGHMTIFTQTAAGGWPIDTITNRLFALADHLADQAGTFNLPGAAIFEDLFQKGCRFLILEAIARHTRIFTSAYRNYFTSRSPVRLSYLSNLKPRLKRQFHSINHNETIPMEMMIRMTVALGR